MGTVLAAFPVVTSKLLARRGVQQRTSYMNPHRVFAFVALALPLSLSAAPVSTPAPNATPAVAPPAAVTPNTTPRAKLGSSVFKWEDLAVRVSPVGERRNIADNPTPTLEVFECHITTLNPGKASHPPHQHNQEELIFVKEGSVEIHLNGKTERAGAGSVFFYAANDMHNIANVGETRATYWVINLATAATHDLAKHNKSSTRPSGIFDWTKMTAVPTPTGERRDVLNGSTVTLQNLSVHITTVNPGQATHAAHRHPDEEIVVVKEGALDVTISGKTERATAGSVILFASNDLHGMRNAGDTRATYYVVRLTTTATPKPATN